MKTKFLLGLAVLCICLSLCEISGNAEEQKDYIRGRSMTEEEIEAVRTAVEQFAGQGTYLSEEEQLIGSYYSSLLLNSGTEAEELPVSYDVRQDGLRTAVKTQRYGDCWAFAALELLELNAQKKGLASTMDLSERHLVYYTFHSVKGTPGQQEGEGTTYEDGGTPQVCFRNGGRFGYAIRTLGSFAGAVDETRVPYEDADLTLPQVGELVYENARVRLKNAYKLPTGHRATIKKAVLEYGAVGITYYSGLEYYNYDTAAQYSPVDVREDHAVVIVGWDDTYSKDNFKKSPSGDGAWLVKNNWGQIFGDGGYFWLSYEDASLAAGAYVMEAESVAAYDNIYQCDNTLLDGTVMGEEQLSVANVYTIGPEEAGGEQLKAVSITIPTGNLTYEVRFYKNPGEDNPESGELLSGMTVTGELPYAGLHTLEIPNSPEFTAETRIAAVLHLTGQNPGINTDVTGLSYRTRCNAVGGERTSYLKQDGTWLDYGVAENRNFRLKLLTKNVSEKEEGCSAQEVLGLYQKVIRALEQGEPEAALGTLYGGLFHRAGERAGVEDWSRRLEAGMTGIQLLEGFVSSEEFRKVYPVLWKDRGAIVAGCLEWELETDLKEIQALYVNLLQREYDLQGLIWWGELKKQGALPETIESGFRNSEEYLAKNSDSF